MITLRIAYQIGVAVVALSTSCGPVIALEASDTIASWKSASSAEKAKLVTELLKRDGRAEDASGVTRCLDAAASFPGHAELPIGQVFEACEKDQGQPV